MSFIPVLNFCAFDGIISSYVWVLLLGY